MKILDDKQNPIKEGFKMFTILMKPILNDKSNANSSGCVFLSPDVANIVIEDFADDGKVKLNLTVE